MSTPIEERVEKLEAKVTRLFTHAGIPEDPIIIDPSILPRPTAEGMVFNAANQDAYIYNPVIMRDGIFTTFANKGGSIRKLESGNGLNGWLQTVTGSLPAPYGSIIFTPAGWGGYDNDAWRGSAHMHQGGGVYQSYYYGSQNGAVWAQTAYDRTQNCGEDRNLLMDGEFVNNYIRVKAKPRTIGLCRSNNFRIWTPIVEILAPDSTDGNLTQFYQMSVIKTMVGYFGLLTTYRIGNQGQDVEQMPPYTGEEHTTDLQVVWSSDGKTNWKRCDNRRNFIPRKEGVKQIYGWWSVIGDQVYIYTAESKRRHTISENQNVAGNYFYSERYKISVADIEKYKPTI